MKSNSKISFILCIAQFILAFLLSFGIKFWFHGCKAMEGSCKPCVDAENAVIMIGIIILVLAFMEFIFRDSLSRRAFSISILAASAAAMFLPKHMIALCMMPDMRCLSVMYPAILLIGGLLFLLSVIQIFINR